MPSDSDEGPWFGPGDWWEYEAYVAGILSRRFPAATVMRNAKIIGRLSGIERQIDVLVDDGELLAVDCKYYARRIDVKHVESFLGMLADLNVRAGVLVTTKGYTKGALRRVQDVPEIDLQILPPEQLSSFQYMGSPLIWRAGLGVFLERPPGWVLDDEPLHPELGPLIKFYPLGHTLDSAAGTAGFGYADILAKDSEFNSIQEWSDFHQAGTLSDDPTARFTLERITVTDLDGVTREGLLRNAKVHASAYGEEHCLYVDYDKNVLLLVMLSPPNAASEIVARLMTMARSALPIRVRDFANS